MTFVDTWAWVALANRRDQYHALARQTYAQLRRARRKLVLSDFIFGEVVTFLYDDLPAPMAERYVEQLLAKVDGGDYQMVHVSPQPVRTAWQLRKRYHDKPDISFVDLTSMAVMLDRGITDIFTGDGHFLHVGLGFRLVP
jgi:uncharacterized protein